MFLTIFSAAWPSPNCVGSHGVCTHSLFAASMICSGLASASSAAPHSTISVHSVSGRRTTQHRPQKKASFCSPPLSVITNAERRAVASVSRYDNGAIIFIRPERLTSFMFSSIFLVLGCAGNNTSQFCLSATMQSAASMFFSLSGWSVLKSRCTVARMYGACLFSVGLEIGA